MIGGHVSNAGGTSPVGRWLRSNATAFRERAGLMIGGHASDAEGIPAISRWLRNNATTPPEHRVETTGIPEGCQQMRMSVQKPIFIRHPRLLQKLDQLFAKRLHPMMLGLIRDVFLHLWPRRRTHGEGSIAFLPCKLPELDLFVNPHRRGFLQFPHEISETMRGLQPHQQVHVVGHPANTLREPAQPRHRASEVFVQAVPPHGINQRQAVLRGKDDVVVQREKRRGHGFVDQLASLRDAEWLCNLSGGVASLNHRLMASMPPAL